MHDVELASSHFALKLPAGFVETSRDGVASASHAGDEQEVLVAVQRIRPDAPVDVVVDDPPELERIGVTLSLYQYAAGDGRALSAPSSSWRRSGSERRCTDPAAVLARYRNRAP